MLLDRQVTNCSFAVAVAVAAATTVVRAICCGVFWFVAE
jgi:hypothetical protein